MAKFIISESKVLEQYNSLKDIADIISYSSKTNPHISTILEKNTDCKFSIHFNQELKHIQDKSRVLFLAQAWTLEDVKNLIKQNVKSFVVDNEQDLDILLRFLESYDGKIDLMLRLKLQENTIRTEKYFVFGMNSDVINKRIIEISKLKDKIKSLGIHVHKKTQNMSEWYYQKEFESILNKDVLEAIDCIDIGGGLPSYYANTNIDVIPSIFSKIKELKQWLNDMNIELIVEPGRYIAAPSAKLMTKILCIHDNNIIVDASVYNSDMDALIVPVKLMVEDELDRTKGQPYVIKGITPCSMDLFRYRVYLDEPKVGDTIVFLNAGAYNFSTDFCDLPKIEVEIVK